MNTSPTELKNFPAFNEFQRDCLVEVWYMKPEWFGNGISGELPSRNLTLTHNLLGKIGGHPPSTRYAISDSSHKDELMARLWAALQGEHWSPNGEANSLIERRELGHTSMSVGDCFRFSAVNNEGWSTYVVKSVGFERIA